MLSPYSDSRHSQALGNVELHCLRTWSFLFWKLLCFLSVVANAVHIGGVGLAGEKRTNKLCFLQDSGCITCKFALLGWVDLVYFQGVTVCQHVLKIRPETLQIAENVFKTWLERRNWHHVRQTRQCNQTQAISIRCMFAACEKHIPKQHGRRQSRMGSRRFRATSAPGNQYNIYIYIYVCIYLYHDCK